MALPAMVLQTALSGIQRLLNNAHPQHFLYLLSSGMGFRGNGSRPEVSRTDKYKHSPVNVYSGAASTTAQP